VIGSVLGSDIVEAALDTWHDGQTIVRLTWKVRRWLLTADRFQMYEILAQEWVCKPLLLWLAPGVL
jgi:hypothetical protein